MKREGDPHFTENLINFLREKGGKVEGLSQLARDLQKNSGTVFWTLRRLADRKIIELKKDTTKPRSPLIITLKQEFMSGEDWQNYMRPQRSRGVRRVKSLSSLPSWRCEKETCLRARQTYLEDLVRAYTHLGILWRENRRLKKEIAKLNENNSQRREEIEKLRAQLVKLRSSSLSNLSNIKFDRNGVMILPGEEQPDYS